MNFLIQQFDKRWLGEDCSQRIDYELRRMESDSLAVRRLHWIHKFPLDRREIDDMRFPNSVVCGSTLRQNLKLNVVWPCEMLYRSWSRRNKTFSFNGTQFSYFYHTYNRTWTNERTVEIPIALDFMRRNEHQRVLEVGNVLGHYTQFKHDIVDKYEKGADVINQDIVDFTTERGYDLGISISTIEHVGWDTYNETTDAFKVRRVFERLPELLTPGGSFLVTFPVGYNRFLDEMTELQSLKATRTYYMKRISKDNAWIQVEHDGVVHCRFNDPYPFANGLVIAIFETTTAAR